MTKEQRVYIEKTVDFIDDKRKELKEKYKKCYQFKNTGKYRIADQQYLQILLERRNTIVNVLNFIYTGDINYLEELKKC